MFIRGEIYRRRDLHTLYGGQQQGGISTPSNHPVIFLFTSPRGKEYGYSDGWQADGTFLYTGEGQKGDMTFTRGNLAIRDHMRNGRTIHLFEKAHMGHVRYVCELMYVSHAIQTGQDIENKQRQIIVFTLRMISGKSGST
ncbi:MAG: HNH endonuclease [Anaerolinea sp.]